MPEAISPQSAGEPVRVLRVIARMNMGGPAYHVSLLSGRLSGRGFDTLLVTGKVGPGEAPLTDLADSYGARVHGLDSLGPELDPLADARSLGALIRIVRSFRPRIVHTHTAKAGMLGRLAAASVTPRPVVVHTYHGHVLEHYFGPLKSSSFRLMEKALARLSDCLVGVSDATVDDLVRLGVAPPEKFRSIPIGIELDQFAAANTGQRALVRAELGAGEGDVVLVYVGRLVPVKRIDVLLDGMAGALAQGAPVKLALVGDGPERTALAKEVRRLGLENRVRFLGYRRDLAAVAAAADIGVLSSDNEGTPVSLIELGAAGRPLLATDVGGVRDVVRPECGVLVKRGDGSGLAAAIARLASDPALRARMGAAARDHVTVRFSAERLVDDIEALYRELLAVPPRQAAGRAAALGASAR